MATRPISIRVEPGMVERLERVSREEGINRSALIKTLLEEGLRMAEYPGIVFRPGPAGRRPALSAGPDVWEVVRVFRDLDERGEAAIIRTAELASLTPGEVRIVIHYYAAFRDEIDEWLRREDEYAQREEDAWRRAQELLHA